MIFSGFRCAGLFGTLLILAGPAAAQIAPPPPDPLARIRANAAANAEACTVQASSPCAEANPKIIAAAQSSTTLQPNLKRLINDIGQRVTGSPQASKAVAWAVSAFKAAGVDQVHTEKFVVPESWSSQTHPEMLPPIATRGGAAGENVIAEIRGREKPEEYVLLSSHLDSWSLGDGALDAGCNATLVIEAARAIHLTGLRPRRSIRFVLFTGNEQGKLGSWAYVRQHRAELDRIVAAISFDRGTGLVTGFSTGGRPELESAVRETLTAAFDGSWGLSRYTNDATLDSDNIDFLLEGVPNLLANQEDAGYYAFRHTQNDIYEKIDVAKIKHNVAVAGVLVFGLAEQEGAVVPRLSRAKIEELLKKSELVSPRQQAEFWQLWQSGARGRQP